MRCKLESNWDLGLVSTRFHNLSKPAQAPKFFQPNGLVHGQNLIRAADSGYTKMIGNIKYYDRPGYYSCTDYPWYDR